MTKAEGIVHSGLKKDCGDVGDFKFCDEISEAVLRGAGAPEAYIQRAKQMDREADMMRQIAENQERGVKSDLAQLMREFSIE
jgi:hypothetical protein